MGKEQISSIKDDLKKTYERASQSFPDAPEEEQDFLQIFCFICLLCFDIYLRKQMIEKLIDSLMPPAK